MTFAHPAWSGNPMYVNEPQKDFLVLGFVCPRCDKIADTRVADLGVDRDGEAVRVYPWTGSLDDMLDAGWRSFIDRSDPHKIDLLK